MIWILVTLIGCAYAWYRIDKFADDVNPYNFSRRDNDR